MNDLTQKTSYRVRAGIGYQFQIIELAIVIYVRENQALSQRSLCLSEEETIVQSFA